jgi:hypothetical protein
MGERTPEKRQVEDSIASPGTGVHESYRTHEGTRAKADRNPRQVTEGQGERRLHSNLAALTQRLVCQPSKLGMPVRPRRAALPGLSCVLSVGERNQTAKPWSHQPGRGSAKHPETGS